MRNHWRPHVGSSQTDLLLLALRLDHLGRRGQFRRRFLLLLAATVIPPFLFG